MIFRGERPNFFKVDYRTKSKVTHKAYSGSGYDRGHISPNAGIERQYGQMAQLGTYLMSNICPQSPEFNRGIWVELERWVRDSLSQRDVKKEQTKELYVITGPIYLEGKEKVIKEGVAIPSHFYKIILSHKGYSEAYKAFAFIFPNKTERISKVDNYEGFKPYAVAVDEIEEKTGIDFMSNLTASKQKNIESIIYDFNFNKIK